LPATPLFLGRLICGKQQSAINDRRTGGAVQRYSGSAVGGPFAVRATTAATLATSAAMALAKIQGKTIWLGDIGKIVFGDIQLVLKAGALMDMVKSLSLIYGPFGALNTDLVALLMVSYL